MHSSGNWIRKVLLLFFAAFLLPLSGLEKAGAQTYQGFGATTPGGSGGTVVHVTNLNDSGPGSFREAVKEGNRTVVFDVAGEIILTDHVFVTGAFITIDGFTAPSPGITLKNRGLIIRGNKRAHDIIVQGIRVRGSPIDGIQIAFGAHHLVIYKVSVESSDDGNIDITEDSHDVTVSWSILAGNDKNMLIKYNPSHITSHHNIFTESSSRNPQVRIDDAGTPATDTTLDMRNNFIWDWDRNATLVWDGPRANVVNNYYSSSIEAIKVFTASAYVKGNFSVDGRDLNRVGNTTSPFPAPSVDTQSACEAAKLVLANAGVRPLDSVDKEYLSRIPIPSCTCAAPAPTLSVNPDSLSFSAPLGGPDPVPQEITVTKQGSGSLSWDARVMTSVGGSWLSVSPTSGKTPSTVTVTADSSGLAEGLYQGTVIVKADAATNPHEVIPVSLVVGPSPNGPETFQTRIACGGDDGMESSRGTVKTSQAELSPGEGNLLAFRFLGMTIPSGAIIQSAVLRLYVSDNAAKSIKIRYLGEATGDSASFKQVTHNLSNRPKTLAFVDDIPGPWTKGDFNPSPDLTSIIQEIVNLPDWESGNSLTLFMADNGSTQNRSIGSFEGKGPRVQTAILRITYQAP